MATILVNSTIVTRPLVISGSLSPSKACQESMRSVKMAHSLQVPVLRIRSFSGLRASNSSENTVAFGQDFRSKVAISKRGRGSRCVPKAMFQRFSEEAVKAIMLAQEESRRAGLENVGTDQVLLGLIGEGTGIAAKVLKSKGINLRDARVEVEKITGRGDAANPVPLELPFTPDVIRALKLAVEEARQLGHNYIGTEHILLGLLRVGVAGYTLENVGGDLSVFRKEVIRMYDQGDEVSVETGVSNAIPKMPTLEKYGTDLTKLAKEGKLDLLDGRQDEIDRVVKILCRRSKNDPCLNAENPSKNIGVALGNIIVEGLAQRIASRNVPDAIKGKKVIRPDMDDLYHGREFEERLKKIRDEIKQSGNLILFIDESHVNILQAGPAEGAIYAANILKPPLARDELQCIVATTFVEYEKHIEKDPALERFVPVKVAPISFAEVKHYTKPGISGQVKKVLKEY